MTSTTMMVRVMGVPFVLFSQFLITLHMFNHFVCLLKQPLSSVSFARLFLFSKCKITT